MQCYVKQMNNPYQTLRNGEQGRRTPAGPARVLLLVGRLARHQAFGPVIEITVWYEKCVETHCVRGVNPFQRVLGCARLRFQP